MAIGANSYGSVAEVEALTRHFAGGAGFTAATTPRLTEVEKFIDRCSGLLNSALAAYGFDVPVTQADVLLSLDDWVVTKAAALVELTQRGAGFSDAENTRGHTLYKLHEQAMSFVAANMRGWQRLGAAMDNVTSTGLAFTADDRRSERPDPDNTTREQPLFNRRQFDVPGLYSGRNADEGDY